jgi:hypothetical protein
LNYEVESESSNSEENEAKDFLQNFAFFELDEDMNPIRIIQRAKLTPELTRLDGTTFTSLKNHSVIFADLTIISNDEIEPLQWDY